MDEETLRTSRTHWAERNSYVNNDAVEEEPSDIPFVKEEEEYEFITSSMTVQEHDPLAIDEANDVSQSPVGSCGGITPVTLGVKLEPHSSETSCIDDCSPSKRLRNKEEAEFADEGDVICLSDEEETLIRDEEPSRVHPPKLTQAIETDPLELPNGSPNYFWACQEVPCHVIPFSGRPGLAWPRIVHDTSTPCDYFKLIATDEFFDIFVHQTNACGSEMAKGNGGRTKRRGIQSLVSQWKPLCTQELETWLAILIQMGGIQCPSLTDYWSSELLQQSTFFTKVSPLMQKDRWIGIMQALHFQDSDNTEPGKLFFQFNPLIRSFNARMKFLYGPSRELFLEEPMVMGQDGLTPWCCLRDKTQGIKLHSLTDAEGLILRFSPDKMDVSHEPTARGVVTTLLEDFNGKGHSVFMDSCYNSVDLCHDLLSRRFHTSGPLSPLRKNIPEQILDSKLEPGKLVYMKSNHGVVLMKWREDNEQALFLSSEFSQCLVETSPPGEQRKPEAVAVINKYLSEFGKPFQALSEFGAVLKHTNNHVKIIVHIIEMAVYNAFVLYRKFCSSNLDFVGFRREVVRKLCNFKKIMIPRVPLSKVESQTKSELWHRLELTEYVPSAKRSRRRAQLECVQCLKKHKTHIVISFCVMCPEHPGLGVGDCFVQWHLGLGYSNVIGADGKTTNRPDKSD